MPTLQGPSPRQGLYEHRRDRKTCRDAVRNEDGDRDRGRSPGALPDTEGQVSSRPSWRRSVTACQGPSSAQAELVVAGWLLHGLRGVTGRAAGGTLTSSLTPQGSSVERSGYSVQDRFLCQQQVSRRGRVLGKDEGSRLPQGVTGVVRPGRGFPWLGDGHRPWAGAGATRTRGPSAAFPASPLPLSGDFSPAGPQLCRKATVCSSRQIRTHVGAPSEGAVPSG